VFSAQNDQRTLRLSPPVSPLRREVQAFLIDRQARGLSPRPVSSYAAKTAPLVTFLETREVFQVQAITPDHLRRFLLDQSERRSPGWPARVSKVGQSLPAMVGGRDRSLRRAGAARLKRSPRREQPWRPLTPSTYRTCVPCSPHASAGPSRADRDGALMLAMLDTGCRASESLALDLGDLALRTGAACLLFLRRDNGWGICQHRLKTDPLPPVEI